MEFGCSVLEEVAGDLVGRVGCVNNDIVLGSVAGAEGRDRGSQRERRGFPCRGEQERGLVQGSSWGKQHTKRIQDV